MDNAKILRQAAAIAYEQPAVCEEWLVAFRGTQPNRPVDWLSDAKARHLRWGHNVGKVHTGSYEALDVVWKDGQGELPRRRSNSSLDFQERRDEIIRARWNAILPSGIENVTDHDLRECYLARLGATFHQA